MRVRPSSWIPWVHATVVRMCACAHATVESHVFILHPIHAARDGTDFGRITQDRSGWRMTRRPKGSNVVAEGGSLDVQRRLQSSKQSSEHTREPSMDHTGLTTCPHFKTNIVKNRKNSNNYKTNIEADLQLCVNRPAAVGATRTASDGRAVRALLTNSGNWFHSTRQSTAELLNARLHRASHRVSQPLIAACYVTNCRYW